MNGAGQDYALITGGAGFIGSNLADRLAGEGWQVLLYDNLHRAHVAENARWLKQRHGDRIQVEVSDIRDAAAVSAAVEGAARVYHFAGQVAVTTSVTDPVADFEVNARGTLNVLEAIRARAEPPPLIFTSTNKVYGKLGDLALVDAGNRYEPQNPAVRSRGISEAQPLELYSPYGCSKGAADQYVLDYARIYGLPTVVFRMSCIYGPRQFGTEDQGWVAHFLISALRGEPITIYGDGKQVRDILFVDDLVEAFLLAGRHLDRLRGCAFNIGGGPRNAVSLLETLERIGGHLGRPLPLEFATQRPGDQLYYVSDTSAFEAATGWSAAVDPNAGLHRLMQWLQERFRSPDSQPEVAAVSPGVERAMTQAPRLDIVIIGLSITSSWGNGHATTYRALVRELVRRGHSVTFLERDVPWYAASRDLPDPPFGRTILYQSLAELKQRWTPLARAADLVIVGSYVPEGVAVAHWALDHASGVTGFYDIDTPVTLAKLEAGDEEYLTAALIPRFDLYLSFTGGPILERLERRYGARAARPLYCSVDPDLYRPDPEPIRWDLGYLGTYSPDRQPKVDSLLVEPARLWPEGRFVVAGPQYPAEIAWPGNVERIEHLPPPDHARFYNAQRFTLNVTRDAMVAAGWSPSVRLFEAAACGVPIVSDWWEGLDSLFVPGEEVLVARSGPEVATVLRDTPEARAREIGGAARRRVLAEHTAAHRAATLEAYALEARQRANALLGT